MSALALGLLVVLAIATAAFYVAGVHGYGSPWARDVCSLSRELCDHPGWSAIATGGVAVIYLVLRAFRL
jgi:hypothetical protein